MLDTSRLRIDPSLSLPKGEIAFHASRSGGPGGQHVNTSSTRVELWWNPRESPSLTVEQRERLLHRLEPRLTADGWLRIVASETRSQSRNRDAALERFREIVATALVVPKRRRPTRPSKAVKKRRLEEKRHRGDRKRGRQRPATDE